MKISLVLSLRKVIVYIQKQTRSKRTTIVLLFGLVMTLQHFTRIVKISFQLALE